MAEGFIQDSSGGGGINISSNPAGSGTWAGVTVYQDPTPFNSCKLFLRCREPIDTTYDSLTWDGNSAKTGVGQLQRRLCTMPNANLILNGATDKASNGYNCFSMTLNSIDSNGGNGFSMFANPLSQCGQQGTADPPHHGSPRMRARRMTDFRGLMSRRTLSLDNSKSGASAAPPQWSSRLRCSY